MNFALPSASAPRCAAAVGNDYTKPLISKPLRCEIRAAGAQHTLCMRAAIGIKQHGKHGTIVILGQNYGGCNVARPNAMKRDVGSDERLFGVIGQLVVIVYEGSRTASF